MCATQLVDLGYKVDLFEKRAGLGRKLLIAGSSGLNITHDLPDAEFAKLYQSPSNHGFFTRSFSAFTPKNWLSFLETRLGMETFLGTSSRYFVKEMKASNLLKQWTEWLKKQGVEIYTDHEIQDFLSEKNGVTLQFKTQNGPIEKSYSKACLALGGASWEDTDTPPWVSIFEKKGIVITPFQASNVGYEIDWPIKFFAECGRSPLKNIVLTTKKGSKEGELLITEYGIEGTPVYFVGSPGKAFLDLKPAWDLKEVIQKLSQGKENLSPIRRAKKFLNLSPPALAFLFHFTTEKDRSDLKNLAALIKKLPILLKGPRPLSEAISSSGGVSMVEVDQNLMLKKVPGIFLCGEMLDWDAPTGGFLIQGAVLQGVVAARAMHSV
jgi:uncharacterized flavoprotein (TIGR03862 family)